MVVVAMDNEVDCKSFYSPDNSTSIKICNPSNYGDIRIVSISEDCISLENTPLFDELDICNV